ncbi:xanthine dehydrogenase family protein molybdopterin-binding subunit [Halieaceae bacterium IMCC14734]|uniref:Xanthine dehydrogenase family protein molybdopterin-binding subunit n=1 Tax=Candidatus Litorirhabdus singularis TaxID=2518993 RepID=A0ABT3TGG8_9GAMM|nr:molybdopterin cofactor-binding domain-containing protein [Candidatus Litorirhabdus singularis]MCX2980519.1 xanthine dehydrogenase family protein molybdopterin-binding subunit [Candidatus Litorirhabdus singularis]
MGKWTRRGFITAGVVGSGAMVIGVALRPGHTTPEAAKLMAGDTEAMISTWVKIDSDNHITAVIPHSEMGQGAQTALAQMLADEMDASWEQVSFVEAPAEDVYANWAAAKGFILGDTAVPKLLVGTVDGLFMQASKAMHLQITGGSASIRTTGVYGMRVAGAAARQMLMEAAAADWAVDIADITTIDGMLIHEASGKREPYATFAAAAGKEKPPLSPQLKTPDQFKIMGKNKPRHDIPSKVDGSAMFGIDASVDGMHYASVKAAPVFGAQVASVDATAARSMPGFVDVVNLDDAIAVVATGYWQAKQALAAVQIEWTATGNEDVDSENVFKAFQADMETADAAGETNSDMQVGDTASEFDGADSIISRQYKVPYLAHTCMEPMNALARFENGQCEIWTGTQNPLGCRYDVAQALELDVENVSIVQHTMGGGFGRRSKSDAAIQAARIARAVGLPVKLIWSREEDVQHDHYRPAVASNFRATLNSAGQPQAWENLYVDKHEPAEAPHIPYAIPHQKIHYVDSPTHVPFGAWRSVDHSQHGFFVESFIDELAHEARQDPYQYRRNLLADHPRHRKVLDMAAEKANWDTPLGENRGRGISLQESFGSLVAEVVEVTVIDGNVSVDRVVVAVDAGFAVSPDGLTAQMESGVVYGLTAALYGEVSIDEGRVKQTNFNDYPMLRMSESPVIETHIINSHETWGGAGEPGTPGIAPALTNAIFAASGNRIRELPVSKYDFTYEFREQRES